MSPLIELFRAPLGGEGQCARGARMPLRGNGYVQIYRSGEINHCPGCGMSQWIIGRIMAECAFCATAVPLQHTDPKGSALGHLYWERDVLRHGWHFGDSRQSTATCALG